MTKPQSTIFKASIDKSSTKLPVMESFYTVQGEGNFSGTSAYFIRLGGCDVGCTWCDVKESWPMEGHELQTIEEIVNDVNKHPSQHVVITGGEPLMYDLEHLTTMISKSGKKLHLETSGAHQLSGNWHWICLSPKKFKQPVEEIHHKADELKIIVFNKHDFIWAEEHAKLVDEKCQLFLQPEWEKREKIMPEIVDYVKANPKWKISLQTHKYLDIP